MHLEYGELLTYFTQLEMDINQVKKRTARGIYTIQYIQIIQYFPLLLGYAIKDVAVKYIFDHHKDVFLSLGHPWEEYLEYLNGKQKDVIRYMHIGN